MMIRVLPLIGLLGNLPAYSHSQPDSAGAYTCEVDAATENASNEPGYTDLTSAPTEITIVLAECESLTSTNECSPGNSFSLRLSPALFADADESKYEGDYGLFESAKHGIITITAGRFYATSTLVDVPETGEKTTLFATGPCTKSAFSSRANQIPIG